MKQIVISVMVVLVTGLSGCATTQPHKHQYYTHAEVIKMTYCFGLTDTTMYVATQKLKHRPKLQLLDYYESRPNAKLNIAMVNKVYADHFTHAWDYTVNFFNECAARMADVAANRVGFASYCEQNTLIADLAYGYKHYGYPKQQAYQQFAVFKSKTPKRIVDQVYASNKSRAEIKLGVWNSCMANIPLK